MDLKKTGSFIAIKRKEHGYTQAQLGELLGVTNKAVSKWERGVCLPDASLYSELCTILEITINELFAGENLDESEFKQKADGNLTDIMKGFTRKGKRMRMCIILLTFLLLIITAISGYVVKHLIDDGLFKSNYIKSYSFDEDEKFISDILKRPGEDPYVFEFKTGSEFYGIRLTEKVYERGKLTSDEVIFESGMTGNQKGYIICNTGKNTMSNITVNTNDGSFEIAERQVSDKEYAMYASVGLSGIEKISDDEIALVGSYYTNEDDLTVMATPEIVEDYKLKNLKNVDYYVLYSCQFIH